MTPVTLRPAFLGIGPPKTATSWMHKALRQHPEAHLPPMKEIGYWWAQSFLADRRYWSRFFDAHWYYRESRSYLIASGRRHWQALKSGQLAGPALAWDLHYFFWPRTESWYRRLFDGRRVSGDITPKYCELDDAAIAAIQQRFPHLKIILSVRDPVEREWSRAKMNLCLKRGRMIEAIPHQDWLAHFDQPAQAIANDYQGLYARWAEYFGPEQIHLVFYDQVQTDAWQVFNDLCQFLGLSSLPDQEQQRIVRPANVGLTRPIPTHYEAYLFAKHREHMLRFAKAFPHYPYPQQWLQTHATSLGQA
ncbi:MAG: sulfotransferase [Cyanobacteria bacterium P01_G01_bin.54]